MLIMEATTPPKATTPPSAAKLAHWEKKAPAFVSLDLETRTVVDTATAAYHLNRQPQTLRQWASAERGPLRPVHLHGRLAWPVAELRRLVGMRA